MGFCAPPHGSRYTHEVDISIEIDPETPGGAPSGPQRSVEAGASRDVSGPRAAGRGAGLAEPSTDGTLGAPPSTTAFPPSLRRTA